MLRLRRHLYDRVWRILAPALRAETFDWLRFVPSIPPRHGRFVPGRWPDTSDWQAPPACARSAARCATRPPTRRR